LIKYLLALNLLAAENIDTQMVVIAENAFFILYLVKKYFSLDIAWVLDMGPEGLASNIKE
jgi:hypothetical protein